MVRLGIDLGGTKLLGVAIDDAGGVVEEVRAPTPRGGDRVVDALAAAARELAAAAGAEAGAPVGIGAPGLVDRLGRLRVAPNLPGIRELALRERVGGRLGVPVRVENDATCAAWAEHVAGAASGSGSSLLVTLGTGIGGGMVVDGVLQLGSQGFAGEFGHMVLDPDGPPCPCGRRGCWERLASGTALGRLGREAARAGGLTRVVDLAGGDPEGIEGAHVTSAALEGDTEAGRLLDGVARWLGIGLANLLNVLDPEVVVVGGGLVAVADLLLPTARRVCAEEVLSSQVRAEVAIVPAGLGEHAGATGAALLAAAAD